MAANTPPLPHEEGDRFTNDETGIKYQFVNGAWRAVSSEASEEVADAIKNLDLQTVLDNGAVANKGMVLKTSDPGIEGSSEYDAIEIIPAGARVIVSAEDNAGWKPTLELVELVPQNAGETRKAQIELDDNRLDINVDSVEDEIHFRFNDNDKLVLKGMTEPSQLKGKLIVEPGTSENEVVTYGQLSTLEEEIEQLAPSFERGLYAISTQEVTSSSTHNGKYNLVRKNNSSDNNAARKACSDARDACKRNPSNDEIECENKYYQCESQIPAVGTVDKYITNFSEVQQLRFSKVDVNGQDHTWDGVLIGQLIDVFNEDNDNYMVGRITAIEGTTVKTFNVDVLSSKGSASGNARIKVFSLSETGDVTNYVRKTGDEMTGQLKITGSSKSGPLLLVEPTTAGKADTLFAVNNKDGDPVFDVANNGQAFYERRADADAEIVNKAYVDEAIKAYIDKAYIDEAIKAATTPKPSNYSWKLILSSRDPAPGEMCTAFNKLSKGNTIRLSHTDYDGNTFFKRTSEIFHNSALNEPLITIWDKTDEGYRHKQTMAVRSISADANSNFLVEIGESVGAKNHNLSNGVQHWVTIAGFF